MTSGLIPQVIRVWKLKSAREISFLFTILFLVGAACWTAYGVFLQLPSVIFWNAIAFSLMLGLLYAKLKYGR
jgi:MtN3 and saliva related transmembrane protein